MKSGETKTLDDYYTNVSVRSCTHRKVALRISWNHQEIAPSSCDGAEGDADDI